MLVLSRAVDEKIRIGDDITITVVRIREFDVRLGIEAPPATPVHREEIYDRLCLRRDTLDDSGPA